MPSTIIKGASATKIPISIPFYLSPILSLHPGDLDISPVGVGGGYPGANSVKAYLASFLLRPTISSLRLADPGF